MNKILRPSVWVYYADEQLIRDIRRGRFIVPTADLSALGGCSDTVMKKLICIIAPTGWILAITSHLSL
jgi:hypothetical protein